MSTTINLTPHAITVCGVVLPPTGTIARLVDIVGEELSIDIEGASIPVTEHSYGVAIDLPEEQDQVWLIVSAVVRLARPQRHDLLSPGALERDEEGRITGCTGFYVN